MGDAAGGKTKKSKKHSEDSASHEAVATSSALIASPAPVSSNTPHILVQGGDSNEGKEKTRRPSKNTLTVSGSRPDEKIKDKSKDKQARKLAKEPSHSSQTTPAPHTTESPILHESEVYKWAGRLKGMHLLTLILAHILHPFKPRYSLRGSLKSIFSVTFLKPAPVHPAPSSLASHYMPNSLGYRDHGGVEMFEIIQMDKTRIHKHFLGSAF